MKFIFCQISNKLLNPPDNSIRQRFFDTFYENKHKDGFYRPDHFWELPKWIAEMCHVIPDNDRHDKKLLIIDDLGKTIEYNAMTRLCFSVLDDNKEIIRDIVLKYKYAYFILGGYIDKDYFADCLNITWYGSIKEFAEDFEFDYSYGCDWSLFAGEKTIPRLTLSTGCLNKCKFCAIKHKLTEVRSGDVINQIHAFKGLKFKLIYIDDKTFGQSKNCDMLRQYFYSIIEYNPDFEGFIVQTTANEILDKPESFWIDNHIKYVEIGAETFNDNILKKYNKPHTMEQVIQATIKLSGMNIKPIWNIMLGMPEETELTYTNTVSAIYTFQPYSINVNTLAKHNSQDDCLENSNKRSWLNDDQQEIVDHYSDIIFELGLEIVK